MDDASVRELATMSSTLARVRNSCAACRKQKDDLKKCGRCLDAKYCSVVCQKLHYAAHKRECRHLEALFSEYDCPICLLPYPPAEPETQNWSRTYKSCCGQYICQGCIYQLHCRDQLDACPLCRSPGPGSNEKEVERLEKRMALGDSKAFTVLGCTYLCGHLDLPRDNVKALELFQKGSELGSPDSMYNMGSEYFGGGFLPQDAAKATLLYQRAAMLGNDEARLYLGGLDKFLHPQRSIRHYMLAARSGNGRALTTVQEWYSADTRQITITKKDYEKVLRDYQKCVDDAKSDVRDEAMAAFRRGLKPDCPGLKRPT